MSNQVGNLVYQHTLSNGVQIDMREVPGFGTRSEIGFFIFGQCLGTFVVDQKRTGNAVVQPTMMRKLTLKDGEGFVEEGQPLNQESAPSLSDVVDDDEIDSL